MLSLKPKVTHTTTVHMDTDCLDTVTPLTVTLPLTDTLPLTATVTTMADSGRDPLSQNLITVVTAATEDTDMVDTDTEDTGAAMEDTVDTEEDTTVDFFNS